MQRGELADDLVRMRRCAGSGEGRGVGGIPEADAPERFQFEMLCISARMACRVAESVFFSLTSGRAALCRPARKRRIAAPCSGDFRCRTAF